MDGLPIRIKQVDGTDEEVADVLKELHEECFPDAAAPMIDPEQDMWWLAVLPDGGAVAFAGLSPSASVPQAGYLYRSGVTGSYRGQGLQMRLIRVREAKARKLGWTMLRSDTTKNVPSANNLIKAGYRLFTPEYPWGFADTLYWRKLL